MTPEGKRKERLRKRCHANGWGCHPIQHPSSRGWPDEGVMIPFGFEVRVETKAPGVRHSKKHLAEQAATRQMLRDNGFHAVLLQNDDEIDEFMDALEVVFIKYAK